MFVNKLVVTLAEALPMPSGLRWRIASKVAPYQPSDGSYQATANMREGFRMSLDRRAPVERKMYYSGIYNPWLTHMFKRLLRSGDTMVDGGANIGFFSLLGAKCVGRCGAVHAFEPIPATFAQLSENIKLNSVANIHINRVALGSEAGETDFEMPQEADTRLDLNRLATSVLTGRGPRIAVRMRTLDEYAEAEGVGHIRFIKLDIEGGEVAAIGGMRQLLSSRRVDYFICEVNVPLLERQGLKASAIRDALTSYGYEAYLISGAGGFKRPVSVNLIHSSKMPKQDIYGDYLFVAPGLSAPQTSR
jgi:FkbM family methyltransferase